MDQNPEIWAEIPAVTSSLRELRQIEVTFCSGVLVILPGQNKEWLQRARQGTCKTLRGRPWPLGGGTEPFLSASRQCFRSRSLQFLQQASPTTVSPHPSFFFFASSLANFVLVNIEGALRLKCTPSLADDEPGDGRGGGTYFLPHRCYRWWNLGVWDS